MNRGFTLIEVAVALTLLGLTFATLLPAARLQRDRSAVLAAREVVVGVVARTRARARIQGWAVTVLEVSPPEVRIEVADSVIQRHRFMQFPGVELSLSGGRQSVRLRFDALGIGRVASQTITLRRGRAEAGLTLSSYGRIRRR